MNRENAARTVGEMSDARREDSLNSSLDRAINALENELEGLDNSANALDGQSAPRPPAGKSEVKASTPGHTLWKAKHLEDLIGRVGELSQRIYANIG